MAENSVQWLEVVHAPLQRHRLSTEYPIAGSPEWETLSESMKARGFDEAKPITVFEGKVLDGWHRYSVARKLRIPCAYFPFVGTEKEAEDFVFQENFIKRIIPKRQKAAILISTALRRNERPPSVQRIRKLTGCSQSEANRVLHVGASSPEGVQKLASGKQNLDRVLLSTKRRPSATLHLEPIKGKAVLIEQVEAVRASRSETESEMSVEMARCYIQIHGAGIVDE